MDKKKQNYIDDLVAQVRSSAIDRRGFMAGAAAAGLSLSAATSLFNTAQAATPKRGGTFRVAWDDGNTTDSLDPATTSGMYMIAMNHTNHNFLTEITTDNVVGPDLAEDWEASPDAKTWRFNLKKGVEFHNGKTMTSADVIASINHHRGEDTNSAAKSLLDPIVSLKADGDHTVVFELESGTADLPYVLSDYHLVILPANADGTPDALSGIGTGPYKIDHFEAGVRTDLTRNQNYFKEGKANFDEVLYQAVNDPNARQTALVTGSVDASSEPELKTIALMKRSSGVIVDEVASGAHVTMPMHVDTAPFDNNDVRLALKYGIDRQEILDKILQGHGTLGNDHPIGPTLPYYSDIPQRSYDPDKAKFHLKKAGHDTLNISISAAETAFPGSVDMVTLYKQHLTKVGIDLDIVREPNDGYWSNVWLKKPFCVVGWGARPTPDVIFSIAYSKGAAWNESRYADERFNKLLVEARGEIDEKRRAELYHEMQLMVHDEGGSVIPMFRNRVYLRRDNVMHGSKLTGNWPLDGARAAERWWFA